MPVPTRPSPTQTIKVTGSDKMIAPRVVPKRGAKKVKAARLPNVEDRPDEDGSDNNVNSDEFIDSLKASDDPMMHKFAAYLSAKDKAISTLEQQVKFEQDKRPVACARSGPELLSITTAEA